MKIKTSTRISIIFSVFTFFLIFFLLIALHISLFFSWYNKEVLEFKDLNNLGDIINESYSEIIKDEISWVENNEDKEFLEELADWDIFDIRSEKIADYINLFGYLYKKGNKVYIIDQKENGDFHTPYDVSSYYFDQLKSIKLGIILLIIFTLLSYIVAKRLFITLALKDIHSIVEKLKNIDLYNLKKIDVDIHKDDEIHIIVDSINHFLELIDTNTKNLESFNTQVAHEFKTPLMVISSELEYLELRWKKNESSKRVEHQIKKLDSLLEHFLLLTKIQNRKNIYREKLSLKEIIQENIIIFEKKYAGENITLQMNIDETYILETNKDFLNIIIKNILDNAYKYNKKWGKIKIILEKDILTISDTGVGIDTKNIKKIWNNLYRENAFWDGYWVGLNLVKKIIDVLGYKIDVTSIKNKGTKFSISFK